MNNKIGSTHLSRQAYVYHPQSTAYQVVIEPPMTVINYENRMLNSGYAPSVAAAAIDEAVATHVLEAVTTEQLDISLAVLEELDQQALDLEHQWQLKLERARYEASRRKHRVRATKCNLQL